MKNWVFIFLLSVSLPSLGQGILLPKTLREISGLEYLDERQFVAINDSGNEPELFIVDRKGELIKTVKVLNATNEDWEDLASDGTFLYIGDFGNNLNKRQDLCIYKVALESIREKDEVKAEKISFSYNEQKAFPPEKPDKRFDAEGMAFFEGELWIFTKVNDQPWTGKSLVYRLPIEPGKYELKAEKELYIGPDGWWMDAITGADQYGGQFYLTTYNRILKFNLKGEKAECLARYNYPFMTQKESITVLGEYVWVADEYQSLLGGGKLYKIPLSEFSDLEPK